MLAKMQSSWNSHILLVGLQNSIITLEKMLAASYKIKYIAMTILSINPTEINEKLMFLEQWYPNVCSDSIYDCQIGNAPILIHTVGNYVGANN